MTKTKQSFILTLLFIGSIFFIGPASADGRNFNPDRMVSKMTEKLNLSEDQAAQLRTIFEARKSRLQDMRQQMQSILTEEQRQGLKQMRSQRRNGGERMSKEERRAKMQELGISREQMQQLRDLRQQMKQERKGAKDELSSVLTPEQQARWEELKANRKNRRGQRGQRGRRGQGRQGNR